ncbi:MAG: glycosyltransferase family 2 protein, partial [Deltaproteobacteria bacterium]
MNTPVTISVVMPVYNREKFIRQALDSVLAQTLPPLEIIVVDDGSTDGTRDILKDYGRRVRTIRTRNSGGCSVPRNIAIREAKGSHIALMDSDDIWFRKKLEHQVDIARLHPGVDFICSDFITRHEDRKLVHQFGEKRYGAEIRAQDLVFDRPFDAFPLLLSRNFVGCPSTVVFSKRLIDKVGYFTALY